MLSEHIDTMVENTTAIIYENIEKAGNEYKEYLNEIFSFIDEEEMDILKKLKRGESLLDSIVNAFEQYRAKEQERLTFGEVFEQILKKHNVDKNDFADQIPVAANSVYRWMRKKGDSLPDDDKYMKIIKAMDDYVGVETEQIELFKLKYHFAKADEQTKMNIKYIISILDSLLILKSDEEKSLDKKITFDVYGRNSALGINLDQVDVGFFNGYLQVISIMNSLIDEVSSDYEVLFISPFKVDVLDREVIVKVLDGMIRKVEKSDLDEDKKSANGAVKHYFKLYEGSTGENIQANSDVIEYAAKLGMRHSGSYKPYYLLEKAENTFATAYFDNFIFIRDEKGKEKLLLKFSKDLNKAKLFNFEKIDAMGEAQKEAAWDLEMCLRIEALAEGNKLFSSYTTNELILESFKYEQKCKKFYFLRYGMSCMTTYWKVIVRTECCNKNIENPEQIEMAIVAIINSKISLDEKMIEIKKIITENSLFNQFDEESFKLIMPMIVRQEMWFNRLKRKEIKVHMVSCYKGYEDFTKKKFLADTGDFKYRFTDNEIQQFMKNRHHDYVERKTDNYKLTFIREDALKLIPYIKEFDILLYEDNFESVLIIAPVNNNYIPKNEKDFPPKPYENSLVIKQKDIVNAFKDYHLNVLSHVCMSEKETMKMFEERLIR